MANLSKELNSLIKNAQSKLIGKGFVMPVKVNDGILVGNVKIVSDGPIKNLLRNGEVIFSNISLNVVAIRLANLVATNKNWNIIQDLYRADQEYGKWYTDCHMLMGSHRAALKNKDYDKAEILYIRYIESKSKAVAAKNKAEALSNL